MAYVLEKITLEDREKIIKDAECNPINHNSLIYAKDHHEFPETWAIDHKRNCYLFSAPILMREETWNRPYFIFFQNTLYKINTEGMDGHGVYFDEKQKISPLLIIELKQEIMAAFAVYGRYGDGPLNTHGIPVWAIVPEFKEVV